MTIDLWILLLAFACALVSFIAALMAERKWQIILTIIGSVALVVGGVLTYVSTTAMERDLAETKAMAASDRADLAAHGVTPPRQLADGEIAKIVTAATPFGRTVVEVMSDNCSPSEGAAFAKEIASALVAAHWSLTDTVDGTPRTLPQAMGCRLGTPSLSVVARGETQAADALAQALQAAGLHVNRQPFLSDPKSAPITVFVSANDATRS